MAANRRKTIEYAFATRLTPLATNTTLATAARYDTAAQNVRSADARLIAATDRFLLTETPVAAAKTPTNTSSPTRDSSGPRCVDTEIPFVIKLSQ